MTKDPLSATADYIDDNYIAPALKELQSRGLSLEESAVFLLGAAAGVCAAILGHAESAIQLDALSAHIKKEQN